MLKLRVLLLLALTTVVSAQAPVPAPVPATASIEGIVVKKGTAEPLSNVDVELSRVEGTAAAPLGPGVAEAFKSILYSTNQGLPVTGSTPPGSVAPEVRYGKTGADGRFAFKDLKEGKYRLAAVRVGDVYFPAEYGQRDHKQRGLNFPVGAGEAKKDVKVEMAMTGAITGRVVDEDRQPMSHVVVMALTAEFQAGERKVYIQRTVLTDENGDFRIHWLGPGEYYVGAVLEDPQRRTIDMAPTSPPGVFYSRHRATSPVVVRQVLPDGSVHEEVYGVVYYGGVTDLRNAAPLEVRSGETFAGADIPMGVGKLRSQHIRGIVMNGETGQPAAGVQVIAVPRQERPHALLPSAFTNPNGEFDISGALPDEYVLTTVAPVRTTAPVAPGTLPTGERGGGGLAVTVGYVPVDVGNSDANGVRIVTTSGFTISGRLVIEGKSPRDAESELARIGVGLTRDPDLLGTFDGPLPLPSPPPGTPRPAGQTQASGQVTASGEFMMQTAPGEFRIRVDRIPANTYVKSVRLGGDDLLRSGFHVSRAVDNTMEIVIGVDGGSIGGAVMDENLNPFLNATIALVPESQDLRLRPDLYRSTTSDSSGNFQLNTIPPGNYKLFAWEWAEPNSWQFADFIRAFESNGKTVQITSAGKDRVQLNVIRTRR